MLWGSLAERRLWRAASCEHTTVRWSAVKGLWPLNCRTWVCKGLQYALDALDLGVPYRDHLLKHLKAIRVVHEFRANMLSAFMDPRVGVVHAIIDRADARLNLFYQHGMAIIEVSDRAIQRVQAVGDRFKSLSPVPKLLRADRQSSVATLCLVHICTTVATVTAAHPGGSISTSPMRLTCRPGSAAIVKSKPSPWHTGASQL